MNEQKCFYYTGCEHLRYQHECLLYAAVCEETECGYKSKNIFKRIWFNVKLFWNTHIWG